MNAGTRRCIWWLCLCHECPGVPRVLRIRQDGIEWRPAEWARTYHESAVV